MNLSKLKSIGIPRWLIRAASLFVFSILSQGAPASLTDCDWFLKSPKAVEVPVDRLVPGRKIPVKFFPNTLVYSPIDEYPGEDFFRIIMNELGARPAQLPENWNNELNRAGFQVATLKVPLDIGAIRSLRSYGYFAGHLASYKNRPKVATVAFHAAVPKEDQLWNLVELNHELGVRLTRARGGYWTFENSRSQMDIFTLAKAYVERGVVPSAEPILIDILATRD